MNKKVALLIVLIINSCAILHAQNDIYLKDSLGKTVTLTGKAVNAKLGAVLLLKNEESVWIDGLDSWPDGYYLGGDEGKMLKVTGKIIERHDLPVFVHKEGDPIKSGMPVSDESKVKEVSHRYLIQNVKWEVISQ